MTGGKPKAEIPPQYRIWLSRALLLMIVMTIVNTSGCFDVHTARRIFYPAEDDSITFVSGTIASVRYDYKGPIDAFGRVQVGSAEFHREIDNFVIAEGGGNLYLWVQVHFFPDTGSRLDFPRYVNVTLIYMPEGTDPIVMIYSPYYSRSGSEVDVAESVGNIIDPGPGLWSLKVEGVGTSITSGGSTYYDWFRVTVNGVYSDRSYNNNAPGTVVP